MARYVSYLESAVGLLLPSVLFASRETHAVEQLKLLWTLLWTPYCSDSWNRCHKNYFCKARVTMICPRNILLPDTEQ